MSAAGRRAANLTTPIKTTSANKSKIMLPDDEQNTISNILIKNAKNMKRSKNSKLNKANKNKAPSKKKKNGRRNGKFKKAAPKKRKKKGRKKQHEKPEKLEMEEKEEIDPYQMLKQTDSTALIRMFLHKLSEYPLVFQHLGQFGDQLQSSMINFIHDMIAPTLMSEDNVSKFKSIINDRKLIYLLRQSFIRWLLIHKTQMKLLFKRKGDENAKNKLKYDIVVTKNHIIQKLSSTLNRDNADLKAIISQLDAKTKLAYFHYLKSDIKNPFLAQLMTPIPGALLSNTKCNVPSLSGKMPDLDATKHDPNALIHAIVAGGDHADGSGEEKVQEQGVEAKQAEETVHEGYDNMKVQQKLHGLFDGYKDCVLLSEKQILVDILKTQYKLIQNAIDDYGKTRWMDAPIDHGHIRLMQRELIRDHQQIVKKCELIETDYKKKLLQNISEVNKMRRELKKRKEVYLDLIENKCYRFLKEKLSAIHEEIERKKQAIALHEKKRENYLNHAKESLKNEQNMRKGVKLVNDTYHKYLRQLTRSKIEYAVIDNRLSQDQFYSLQEKLNNLRNKNDRYWYWYKKEKEIYSKSIKSLSRINRFLKRIEAFLITEYGEKSEELMTFRKEYYLQVLVHNVDARELNNKYNKEILEKKKISDIEIVYNMKKKDIKLPAANLSVVNRLYSRLKPADIGVGDVGRHERTKTNDESGMFVNNEIKRHQDEHGDDVMGGDGDEAREEEEDQHVNESDEEEEVVEQEQRTGYVRTNDEDIFGGVAVTQEPEEQEYGDGEAEEAQDVKIKRRYDEEDGYEDEYEDDEYEDDEEENEYDATISYEHVIQTATDARSSDKYTENEETATESEDKFVVSQEKGKRDTQNAWQDTVESTVFYGGGGNANTDIATAPHMAKHYSAKNLLPDDGFEDSTQYQQEDEEEEDVDNRPSSTVIKPEPSEQEFQFFAENKYDEMHEEEEEDEEDEEDEDEDEDEDDDAYEYRIKLDNKHEKAQNSLSVSGFGHIGTSFGYDVSGSGGINGFDTPIADGGGHGAAQLIEPPTPFINEDEEEEYDDFYDDDMEHNVVEDDMGNTSFESDDESDDDEDSYDDSYEDD